MRDPGGCLGLGEGPKNRVRVTEGSLGLGEGPKDGVRVSRMG